MDLHTAVTTNVRSHPEIYTVAFGPGFPIEDPGVFKMTVRVPTARARQASLPVARHSDVSEGGAEGQDEELKTQCSLGRLITPIAGSVSYTTIP